jgi:hypothetical protein
MILMFISGIQGNVFAYFVLFHFTFLEKMKCNHSQHEVTHEYIVYTRNKETRDVLSSPLIELFC